MGWFKAADVSPKLECRAFRTRANFGAISSFWPGLSSGPLAALPILSGTADRLCRELADEFHRRSSP